MIRNPHVTPAVLTILIVIGVLASGCSEPAFARSRPA